jgi:hypothetical protein
MLARPGRVGSAKHRSPECRQHATLLLRPRRFCGTGFFLLVQLSPSPPTFPQPHQHMVRPYHCPPSLKLYNRRPMTPKHVCAELERLKFESTSAFLEAKRIRLSRDVSIREDFEMSREGHRRIFALLRHLLVGHDGNACPAGDRPIVSPSKPEPPLALRSRRW